jgi:hypothetical protein
MLAWEVGYLLPDHFVQNSRTYTFDDLSPHSRRALYQLGRPPIPNLRDASTATGNVPAIPSSLRTPRWERTSGQQLRNPELRLHGKDQNGMRYQAAIGLVRWHVRRNVFLLRSTTDEVVLHPSEVGRMAAEEIKHDGRGMISRGRHRYDVPDTPYGERVQDWILEHSVEHLYGPDVVDYAVDELVVLVLLRNGRPYIDQFVEHYLSLGAKHIVFLDNGSTDGSVEAIRNHDNVTVLRTGLPYKRYNVAMKRYCIRRFGRGRWTLTVDIDELFDYPYSDVVSLKNLLGYLNDNSYTAVVSYMLDMFPEKPLSEEITMEGQPLKETHRFYDLSDISSQDYHDIGDIGNTLSNEEVVILKGGVQKKVFQVSPLLTKHPLVFLDEEIRPMDLSDHWAGNARIADFTGVLLHYKLSASLYGLVRREIEERRYISRHGKYDKYAQVLEDAPSVLIKSDTSKELKSVNDLVGSRIVSLSKQYVRFVEDEERKTERYSEERRAERFSEAFFTARAEMAAYAKRIGDLEKRLKEQRRVRLAKRQRRLARRARQSGTESEQHHLAQRAQRAEEQVRAIQSSNLWRVMMLAGGVKARVGHVLARLQNRLLGAK